ncbi:MAG: copper chaperone PCu(A)C [Marinobacter sp.]|nr:copper chaperone PCu(A)C [Marinobacter sp.]
MRALVAVVMGLGLALSPVTMAHDYRVGSLEIDHPWSRPTPPGMPVGVGYMVITNHGSDDVRLVAAESPRTETVSIHESFMEGGVMRMQTMADGLLIPAGATVELKPHSYHLMLEGLNAPLKEGERVALTLTFDGAPTAEVELHVEPLDGDEGHHHHHHH